LTLIPIDRVAADRPFYSGKHRRHAMNLQVIAAPDGEIVWVSGPLPGATHDLTAARIWGIVRESATAGLVVLADKGHHGVGDHVRTPYRGRNKPASQKDANRAHAQLRSPGERAHAQLKTWRILRKLRCCLWRAGQLATKPSTSSRPARSQDEKAQCTRLSSAAPSASFLVPGRGPGFAWSRAYSEAMSKPGSRASALTSRSALTPSPCIELWKQL
jgi:DDE superfamily endonuclease